MTEIKGLPSLKSIEKSFSDKSFFPLKKQIPVLSLAINVSSQSFANLVKLEINDFCKTV